MTRDLLAVGEVLLDVRVRALEPGRTVHAPARVAPGGTPVNAALAAARAGARAAVIGRIGMDAAGAGIAAALREAGVEALLAVDDFLPTGIFVDAGVGESRAIATDRGASAALRLDDIPDELGATVVLVSGYTLLLEDVAPAARAAIGSAGDARWVAVTAGSAPLVRRVGAEAFHERAGGANVVFANAEEAQVLTGLSGEEAALALAREYELAVVTAGAEGGVVATRDGRVEHARPLEVAQAPPAGLGDALAGTFLAALARGTNVRDALQAACAAAFAVAAG